jgi:hypothetical protein
MQIVQKSLTRGSDVTWALAGYSLHAARRGRAEDRRSLSQLIHSMARPAPAEDRLATTPSGEILYQFKASCSEGRMGTRFRRSELIEKRIALMPPRRSLLVRYGGVFARTSNVVMKSSWSLVSIIGLLKR